MTDDIVTRLRYKAKMCNHGLAPNAPEGADVYVTVPCGRCEPLIQAADEIERLREQVTKAHTILGSELFIWFFLSSKYRKSRREQLLPYLGDYWDKYGNAFKEVHHG